MSEQPQFTPIAAREGEAPPTGSYSPGVRWGDLIFVSGQGPIDADGKVVAGTIEAETAMTIANIAAILKAAGAELTDVLSCSCFIADMAEFDRFDEAYARAFGGHRPARTTVQAGLDGIRVEISAIAARKCKD